METAQQAYDGTYEFLPRSQQGLTGWAMHQDMHMRKALESVGPEATAEEWGQALDNDVLSCEVCTGKSST